MRKLICFFIVLLLWVFVGCSSEAPSVEVVLKGVGSVDLVVLVDDPNYAVTEMVKAFADKLGTYTGKNVAVGELSEFDGEDSVYSVYVDTVKSHGSNLPYFDFSFDDETFRTVEGISESISFYEENYEICFGETSAYVIAPNEFALYLALDDFLAEFKEPSYTVLSETKVNVPCGPDSITPSKLIEKVGDVQFLFTEYKVTFVEKYYEADKPGTALLVDGDGRDGMQGGGTDGKYAYYALYEDDIANIYKFDLKDWTLVDVSEALPTGHSNDITYVPEKNVLMVADCTEKDGWAGVYYVDPDTLELLNYGILPYGCRGLDYSPVLQQYVVTGSYTHNIYDKDFNHIRSFNCGFPRDTTQGLYCDGSYVYDSRWGDYTGPDYSGDNRLLIHSIDGEFISEGIIKGDPCKGNSENENVFIYENMFYVGYYNSPRTVNEYVMVPVNMFE